MKKLISWFFLAVLLLGGTGRAASLPQVITRQPASVSAAEAETAALKDVPSAHGFDLTEKDLMDRVVALKKKAAKWTKEKAPGTLDKFPLMPKKFSSLYKTVTKAGSSLKKKGSVYTWTTDIGERLGADADHTAAALYYTHHASDSDKAEMQPAEKGTYRLDLKKADLKCKYIQIKEITDLEYMYFPPHNNVSTTYTISFNPYGKAPFGKKGRSLEFSIFFTRKDVRYSVSWARSANSKGDDTVRISVAWTKKARTHYVFLQYDAKTKKLTDFTRR